MLNSVALTGRVTGRPRLVHTKSGIPMARFTLAVTRPFKPFDTDLIDVLAWRDLAVNSAKYLVKGRLVGIVGRLQIDSWTDSEGRRRRSPAIAADSVQFLDASNPQSRSRAVRPEEEALLG